MRNGIYFNIYRDDESVSTWSEFSSRRSDFPDEVPSSSVYSTIGKTIRSWIRSPMPPKDSYASKASAGEGSVQGEIGELHTGTYAATFPLDEWGKLTGRIRVQPPRLSGSHAVKPFGPAMILPIETPAISLDELNKLTGNFDQRSEVGEGSYGWVFHTILNTGEAAAVKKLYPSSWQETDSDFAAQLLQMSRLKHDHFVGLLGYYLDAKNRILVYPFATQSSLHDILHGMKGARECEPGPVLTWSQRVKIAYGAARGLEYLHKNGVVHGDVRSSNVLVFDDFVSKIADFNLTSQSFESSTRPLGRFLYRAPEYTLTGLSTDKSDVYCFGVVLLELLTGRKPVHHTATKESRSLLLWATPRLVVNKVRELIDPKLNNDYPPKAVAKIAAIAALCVQHEKENRLNMSIAVKAIQPLLEVAEISNTTS